ncbi:MAG: hypothetical protein Q7R45_07845, partial [Sulfuricaulis sp.]|nr:hypothetical protein [Sulfuricaulis sp.]
ELRAKLTDAQAERVRNEEAIASLHDELTTASEARRQTEAGFAALQKENQTLKDQGTLVTAERGQIQQSLAELQARLTDVQVERVRNEETVASLRDELAAEPRLRNDERQQAAARERELNKQLQAANRGEPRVSRALSGRSQETWIGIKPIAIAAIAVLAVGFGAFLFGRHQGKSSGDFPAVAAAIPTATPVPVAVPAVIEPAPNYSATSPAYETGADHIPPAAAVAEGAILPAIKLKGLQARPVGNGLLIVFDKGVFPRRAIMSNEARGLLKQLADQLRPAISACHLKITGYTDPEPVRDGVVPDNLALGYDRALAVVEYFTTECLLPVDALSVFSAGEVNAPYPNTSP